MQEAQSLVCQRCWTSFFSTLNVRILCYTPDLIDYTINISEVENSAVSGCNWCQLLLSLKDDVEERTLGGNHSPLQQIHVQFGSGPREELFTPHGNNRFSLWINGASYLLTAFSADDDPISDIVTARELQNRVASPMAFDHAKKWLQECSSHENCRKVFPTQLPSRVIEVSPDIDPRTPRLLESTAIFDSYVALSYCWGSNQTGLTTKSNIKARLVRLDMDDMSRTIQDAVLVTRKINVKYLWVDAICIIQDSEEDKTAELVKMCNTYQDAFVTIIAANAANANHGFLEDRILPEPSTKIPVWGPDRKLGTVSVRLEGWYYDGNEPINKRAWTLQEQLLSPRLLIYASHTLQYQCEQGIVNLGNSINLPSGAAAWRIPPPSERLNAQDAGRAWGHIILTYSERNLSYLEDKLTALAGVAEAFQQQNYGDYLAGLWSGDMLPRLLLWQASQTSEYSPCPIYTAPSWSWASLNSPVSFQTLYSHSSINWYEVNNLSSHIVPRSPELPFGTVESGYLKLSAHIRHGVFHPMQNIRWDSPSTGSESQKDAASAASAYLDGFPQQERNIVCLAVARRTYDPDSKEGLPVTFGTEARSMFEPPSLEDGSSESVIDGLIIASTGDTGSYRRVGCFYGAEESEFRHFPMEEVTLI